MSLCVLLMLRNVYILLMILYAIFCLPCYCISDNCCLKKCLRIKNNGVSKSVINAIKKQQWQFVDKSDFAEFAMLQKAKNTSDTLHQSMVDEELHKVSVMEMQCLLCLEEF